MGLGDLVSWLLRTVSPTGLLVRVAVNPTLGTEAAKVQRDALQALTGDPSPDEVRRLDRRLKRAVLTDLFRIAGLPDVAGVGAQQLAAKVVPLDPGRAIDTDPLFELSTRGRLGLAEAIRQADRDTVLGPLLT